MKTQNAFGSGQVSGKSLPAILSSFVIGTLIRPVGTMLSVMRWCCGTCCPLC